jgi:hypothetical protein
MVDFLKINMYLYSVLVFRIILLIWVGEGWLGAIKLREISSLAWVARP